MSRSGRKHNSKWDLKEVSPLPYENVQVDDWPQRAGMSFCAKEFQPGWFSPEVAGRNSSKWSIMAANDMLKSKHDLHLPSREPLPGSRGSHRDDSINENRSKNLKSTIAWDADGSYDTNMSPGLDEWRQQNHSRSPKNGWRRLRRSRSWSRSWSRSKSRSRSRSRSRNRSRSRSRSPDRDFRRESGGYDSSRSRSRVSGQLCRDFAAGRCRRGNHCQFLHEGKHNYEDRLDSRHKNAGAAKYSSPHDMRGYPVRSGRSTELCHNFQKGNCRRGEFCKYVHDGASDGFDIGSANEVDRERENERRNIDASYERGGERVIRRSGDIPCKYFAVGNCRNGNHCRFSHHSQLRASPNRRSPDDWRGPGRNSDSLEPVWGDTNTAGHNLADVEQSQDGRKWSDTNKAAKLSEEKNGEMGAPDPRFTSWSMDDRWAHSSDNENITRGDPTVNHTVVESGEKEVIRRKTENAAASMGLSESGGAEKWTGDTERSPLWDYRMQSSNHVIKEGPAHIAQNSQSLTLNDTSLHIYQQDITREASGQMHDPGAITQPVIIEKSYFQQNYLKEDGAIAFSGNEKIANLCIDLNYSANILPGQSFNHNGQSSSAFPPSSSNAVGQSQKEFLTEPPRGGSMKDPQTQVPFQEGQSSKKSDIGDSITSQINSGILPSQKMVSSEQLSQLTNLSASLAQLFGNGQQLPQLYAALNSHNATDVPSSTNSEDLVGQVSAVLTQQNPVINPQKQYDPICDNLEQKKPYTGGHTSNSIGQRHITDGKAEIPSKNFSPTSFAGGPNDGDKTGSIDNELNHKSQMLNQPDSGVNQEGIKVNNGVGAKESKKPQEENKDTKDNDQLENMDEDRRADEGKKGKDVKGIRAFKFALVEFVKELLKPAWKESQVNKDAYKTIVKKVVDKVTGAIQGANIPQTQEKIDHYLSCSKPKLTKLVQAYVEKFQKAG